ncbi:hypothetical protein H4S04_003202 [Coemansia sp. S16]|nr:hypothetical protein H4S04_003202 [Coemansia sp. S16]
MLSTLKALPALANFRGGISGLGPELESITADELPDYIASTYSNIGRNLLVWHTLKQSSHFDDQLVTTIRVRFPERTVCEDCTENDYEDIVVNVPKDTVGHVKDAIAAKLGIETDEFAFEYKYDTTKYNAEANIALD